MKLGQLIDPAAVLVPLQAASVRDATRQLVAALVRSGSITDAATVEQIIEDQWPEDIVPVGSEALVPHFRTDAVAAAVVAVGVSAQPVCRENDPNRCGRIIVLLLTPSAETGLLLRTLRTLHRVLGNPETVASVLEADLPEAVHTIERVTEAEIDSSLQVRDVMTKNVVYIGPDMAIREAARLMAFRQISALPVVDENGSVIGLLSDREIVKVLFPFVSRQSRKSLEHEGDDGQLGSMPVRDAMQRSVLCLSDDQDLEEVARLMVNKDLHHLPVVRDGALNGFLTRNDVVRRLIAH